MPTMLIDLTHDEGIRPNFPGDDGLTILIKALEDVGIVVGKISKRSEFNIDHFQAADVLMIAYPVDRFTEKEIENVVDFVNSGGSLFLTAEWGNLKQNADILNSISKHFGITFNMDRIADSKESFEEEIKLFDEVIKREPRPQFPRITDFADHPINQGVEEIGHFSGCSLHAPEESALAWSSPTSFGDEDADSELDPGEKVGHLITAAHPHISGGRIVAYGDTSILTNKYINRADSKLFVVNTVNWLCKVI
jgi:hypothetical protein